MEASWKTSYWGDRTTGAFFLIELQEYNEFWFMSNSQHWYVNTEGFPDVCIIPVGYLSAF